MSPTERIEQWRIHEHEVLSQKVKMYITMRATLFVGTIAGFGIITNMYRDSIMAKAKIVTGFAGQVVETQSFIPESIAVILVSALVFVITLWVVYTDIFLGRLQSICEKDAVTIECKILDSTKTTTKLIEASYKDDVFFMARGLLVILTMVWMTTFNIITFVL